MAYNRAFNPDALPAHAEPEQAAQALSQLQISQQSQKPLPSRPSPSSSLPPPQRPSPDHRRPMPAAYAAQQAYRPQNTQRIKTDHIYNSGQTPHQAADYRYQLQSPPPPADYGHGPRPHQRQPDYALAPTPAPLNIRREELTSPQRAFAPPDADSNELYPLFRAANVSQTGALTMQELGSALVNADFTPFATITIKSLMRMFSTSPTSREPVIVYTEFQNLWRFLAAWRQLFERFDDDRSGKISIDEFTNALVAFGYNLSQSFINLLYSTYDARPEQRRSSLAGQEEGMSFDLFVQACISLKRMTDVFKTYDDDRDGYVTLSFEEFLSEILRLREP